MLSYLSLTKPRISLLVAITALTALVVEGSLLSQPLRLAIIVVAVFLASGSANAFNQYFERDIDSQMERTAKKRALPLGKLSATQALVFSFLSGLTGSLLLLIWGGVLASALGVATILFHSLYYTLYLKPRTPYNIVIGGAAGAMGPVIGWAAATGHGSRAALLMLAIIFFRTPPHFWALAICCREDYEKVNYPMMPLVKGEELTRKQIVYYSISLIPLSAALYFTGALGGIYLVSAVGLSLLFLWGAFRIYREKTRKVSWQFFGYSIVYLLLLFLVMILDVV